ncbi:MAG TPA: cellulose biosynthesis protein BcsG [Nitrospiria bacterium]|nr:cellulose biosynthesis protein BcsG [Nitrospiria bacterium]
MGLWASYFFAKGALYFAGYIPLSVGWNLLFAAFLAIPTPERIAQRRAVVVARAVLHILIALALLWHDSWLPSWHEAVGFVAMGGLPTPEFVGEFLAGAINPWIVGGLAILLVATAAAHRYMRLTPVVAVLLLTVGAVEFTEPKEAMDRVVHAFLTDEARQVTSFPSHDNAAPACDIVFLHVCSLSWDDLRDVGLDDSPFFRQFDYLLTDFNSVTSHSTIAALRLLRSTCGQTTQEALYRRGHPECYALDALRGAGYQTWFALNHSGEYMGFARDVQAWGHADAPLEIDDLPVSQYDFSGDPIRSDSAVLERWLSERERSGARRAALYYNTISLHIGGRRAGEAVAAGTNEDEYRRDLRILFEEFDRFFARLASSGRDTVVMFVPEHGAALRGTKLQPAGLREIPIRRITNVPVAVKLIGRRPPIGSRPQRVIATPTSYQSLAAFVNEFLTRSPFEEQAWAEGPPAVRVPEIAFVAENEGVRVIQAGTEFFMKQGGAKDQWIKLPSEIAM